MAYSLGSKSLAELQGVHPKLVSLVHHAIGVTSQDFAVHDGLRTIAEQREYVKRGVSKTMNSMHMKQADGYGHAVDLVPFINGKLRWEWPAIFPIAAAMQEASIKHGVPVRWGGCWQNLDDIKQGEAGLKAAVNAYAAARRKAGKSAFLDGPHFEIVR
jgi:peptidoglycan L-alanyl-D-glutamate endopeptidase CwlK